MENLRDLRFQRDEQISKVKALLAKYPGPLPADVSNEVDACLSGIKKIDGKIKAHQLAADNALSASTFSWRDNRGRGLKAVRGFNDIRAHYETSIANEASKLDGEIHLADFLRGVTGMKSTSTVSNALWVGTDSTGGYQVPHVITPDHASWNAARRHMQSSSDVARTRAVTP